MIRVLLVDDHPVVRAGYLRLLTQDQDIEVVAEANNADEGYQAYVTHAPDVTITDVSMPGVGGLGLLQKILAREATARVLVCSMYDSTPVVQRAMQTGAMGFVSKNAQPEELVRAVHAVFRGENFVSPGLNDEWAASVQTDEASRIASLTSREYEIFRLLAQGNSVAECADVMHLSQKTISNHQTQIKEKLQVSTLAAMVHLAQRHQVIEGQSSV
jgi:two-component system invasion response regulator UvrY